MLPKPLQPQPIRWVRQPSGTFDLIATRALAEFEPDEVIASVSKSGRHWQLMLNNQRSSLPIETTTLAVLDEAARRVRLALRPSGALQPARSL